MFGPGAPGEGHVECLAVSGELRAPTPFELRIDVADLVAEG
ncbi:hypothetical protein [Pseudonocardia asaccharolytica]|nr:hypothetical protein [Pseudonocardia asaccharolytica]